MQQRNQFYMELQGLPIDDNVAVDPREFCGALKQQNPDPQSCPSGGTSVPLVPGFGISRETYAATRANGCGDGSLAFHALNLAARVTVPGYTGDPDAPYPGLNIRDICNAHDACYAAQDARSSCDEQFDVALQARVDQNYTPGGEPHRSASNVVRLYASAVGLKGQAPYDKAGAAHRCASWNADMEANQCPR
jgi:hypothetical protein